MQASNPSLLLSVTFLSLFLLLRVVRSPFSSSRAPLVSGPPPPRIAYLITGTDGDARRVLRLLMAVYHPRNHYLLHLDRAAPAEERQALAVAVGRVAPFVAFGNVNLVENADRVDGAGSSKLSSVLHGAAMLLRYNKEWDWFLNLEASDYPLITQDDLLHVLSVVPRDLNFVEHHSDIGWKEYQRIRPIIVDPSLYLASKTQTFYASERRDMPSGYRFFTGSSAVILSRKLLEFSILGWDNFPRTLLLYFSNMKSPHNGYFHTLVCNSKYFRRTVVNSNLRFVSWDNPPGKDPRNLKLQDFPNMVQSGAMFAGRFLQDDHVLDKIDKELLHRRPGSVSPGGWCVGAGVWGSDACHIWGNVDILRPGVSFKRLEKLLLRLMSNVTFHSNQCVYH